MAASSVLYKNDGTDTSKSWGGKLPEIDDESLNWSRDGYTFVEWNTASDGTGESHYAGEVAGGSLWAIWQQIVIPHDVTISYNNTTVTSMDATGSKTLQTAGKFCESNFTIEYTRPTPNLQSKSATPSTGSQTVTPDSGYDGLSQVTVSAMPSGSTTQNAPTINTSTGLVTATATVATGYQVASTKSNTLQLTTQAAQTITPTTTDQTIASGKYLTGAQTIKGDANLVPANIAQGVSIFGVQGTHSGGGGTTIDVAIPPLQLGEIFYIDAAGTFIENDEVYMPTTFTAVEDSLVCIVCGTNISQAEISNLEILTKLNMGSRASFPYVYCCRVTPT